MVLHCQLLIETISYNYQMIWHAVHLIQGLGYTKISTPAVERILDLQNTTNLSAKYLHLDGHELWLCDVLFPGSNRFGGGATLVYDMTMQHWALWVSGGQSFVPEFLIPFGGYTQGLGGSPVLAVGMGSDSTLMTVSSQSYADIGGAIQCSVQTARLDGKSIHQKQLTVLYLLADTSNSIISFTYSDDDSQTFSAVGTIPLSTDTKMFRGLGKFRRRTFTFYHTANTPLRIQEVEVSVTLGGQ